MRPRLLGACPSGRDSSCSDSVEMAERLISTELEKSVASRVESRLPNSILGFLFFARVPAMT